MHSNGPGVPGSRPTYWVVEEPPSLPVPERHPTAQRTARRRGAIAGMAVAIVWLVPPVLASAPVSGLLGFGVPPVLAAMLGGWLIGPRAARVNTGTGALGAILRMAVAVDLLGAAVIAGLLAVLIASEAIVTDGSIGDPATATTLISTLVGAPAVALVGIVFLGPFVLVPLLVPATLWYGILRWWTRDVLQ